MLNILLPIYFVMPARISKKYIPNKKEKYMCEKHKAYFIQRLNEWKNEIIELNSKGLFGSYITSFRDYLERCCPQTMAAYRSVPTNEIEV